MITKTRLASSRIILLGLTASLVSLSAQADVVGASNLDSPASDRLATSLGNIGLAVDNIAPLGLQEPVRDAGKLMSAINVDVAQLERWKDRVMGAIDRGDVTDEIVKPILNTAEQGIDELSQQLANTPLPFHAGQAAGSLLHGVSDTVGNVGDLVRNNPDNPYPISNTLNALSGSLAHATDALFQDGGLQATVNSGLLNGLTSNSPGNAHLLSPVTNLVNATGGGLLNTNTSNDGLLAPVGNLPGGGLAGGLPNTADSNNGLLTPVTGLVTGLLGNASAGPVNNVQASLPANNSATTAAHRGLLAPVTGLVSGLLGGAPH